MGNSGQDMMKNVKANRRLQSIQRKSFQQKFNALHQMNNVQQHQVFNTDFLDESRPEVLQNRKRLAKEIEQLRLENNVKLGISLALTLGIILFWLASCWY